MKSLRNWALLFCLLLFVPSVVTSFNWKFRDLFRSKHGPSPDAEPQRTFKRIFYQPESNPDQHSVPDGTTWFDSDGTPRFYSAWRVKPGVTSPEPLARSSIVKYGARVACWPSSGGIWIKQADLVDLEFLGLSRFDDTSRQFNQTLEDEFCTSLRMVGAEWWELPPPFERRKYLGTDQFACETIESCFEPDVKIDYLIVWPEEVKSACYISMERMARTPEGSINAYHNAMTMMERCDAIRFLGGDWCMCKAECPAIKELDWAHRDPGPDDPPYFVKDPDDEL